MMRKFMVGLAAVVVVLVGVVSLQPADYAVSRSAVVAASPAKVFALVNNIRRWNDWSPWAQMDPSQIVTFEGPPSGVGAALIYQGKKVGAGNLTLVTSEPNRLVGFQMDMREPMTSTAVVEVSLKPEARGTSITVSMRGRNNFLAKAFALVMNGEDCLGDMLQQGLGKLKGLVEAPKGR